MTSHPERLLINCRRIGHAPNVEWAKISLNRRIESMQGKEKPISARCPNCNTPVAYKGPDKDVFFPFCSKRCKLLDLGRWLDEEYKIESEGKKMWIDVN